MPADHQWGCTSSNDIQHSSLAKQPDACTTSQSGGIPTSHNQPCSDCCLHPIRFCSSTTAEHINGGLSRRSPDTHRNRQRVDRFGCSIANDGGHSGVQFSTSELWWFYKPENFSFCWLQIKLNKDKVANFVIWKLIFSLKKLRIFVVSSTMQIAWFHLKHKHIVSYQSLSWLYNPIMPGVGWLGL